MEIVPDPIPLSEALTFLYETVLRLGRGEWASRGSGHRAGQVLAELEKKTAARQEKQP